MESGGEDWRKMFGVELSNWGLDWERTCWGEREREQERGFCDPSRVQCDGLGLATDAGLAVLILKNSGNLRETS